MKTEKLVHCTSPGCMNTFITPIHSKRCYCSVCRAKINSNNRRRKEDSSKTPKQAD